MTANSVQVGAPVVTDPPNLPRPESTPRSGAALSALIARGDRHALGEFYELWFDRLYRFARVQTRRDEAFCLDVVQETMLRVVRSIRPMKTDGDVDRWMMRIAHTTALDLLRKEKRLIAREQRCAQKESVTDEINALHDRIESLRDQLAQMPHDDGRLLWLRFAIGRTLHATGAIAGMSGHAAHGRIRRALVRLRNKTKEELP